MLPVELYSVIKEQLQALSGREYGDNSLVTIRERKSELLCYQLYCSPL